MDIGEGVFVQGGFGYRTAIIKEIGKRTLLVEYPDGKTERVKNSRIVETTDLKGKSQIIRYFKQEKELINY